MPTFPADWDALPADLLAFWRDRHLCSLTTLRPDGTPHVVPVGVAPDLDRGGAWVISDGASRKVRNLAAAGGTGLFAACQVDGRRWSTLEGRATVCPDPADVARAEATYAVRYRKPRPNRTRVALRLEVTRILGSASFG